MTLIVDRITNLITIPKSDLTLVSGTVYKITADFLWQLLRERSDDVDSISFPVLYTNTPPTTSTPRIIEVNPPYTAQFENGPYAVEITNGNSNFRDVEIKNQVSVGTNNTTGFIDPVFLEAALFDGGVALNVLTGWAGTDKTSSGGVIGTRQTPSGNIADAHIIAKKRGFTRIYLLQNISLANEDFQGYTRKFIGDSAIIVAVLLEESTDITNCEFENVQISGVLDGNNILTHSLIGNVTDANGYLENCAIVGNITLGGAVGTLLTLWNCKTNLEDDGSAIINFNNSNVRIMIKDYSGNLTMTNHSSDEVEVIELINGTLTLDASIIAGQFVVRGRGNVIDNTTGTTTVDVSGLDIPGGSVVVDNAAIAMAVWNMPAAGFTTAGTFGQWVHDHLMSVQKFLGMKNN